MPIVFLKTYKGDYFMSKKILTKLEKYFSRGVKIGALATAVLMNAGCDGLFQQCDNQVEVQPQEEQIVDPEQYIFIRHRFAAENAKITGADSTESRVAWSKKHFSSLVDYMTPKIRDLVDKVKYSEPENNFLQPVCQDNFTNNFFWIHRFEYPPAEELRYNEFLGLNTYGNFDRQFDNNNTRYAAVMGAVGAEGRTLKDNYVSGEIHDNRKVFTSALSVLLLRAYNESAGYLCDSPKLPFNQSKDEIHQAALANGVCDAVYKYKDGQPELKIDYEQVERTLNDYLLNASQKTGVSLATLQDAVNLAILHAGMGGGGGYAT